MFSILFIFAGLVAIIVSFWSPVWAWVILGIPEAIILFMFMGVKSQKWKYIPELSGPANVMFQKYGHFYTMPFAARDFSSSASAYQLASIALGIICGFKGVWWGVAVAVGNMILMAFVARAFNPTVFITDPLERLAHDEVISYVMSRQGRSKEPDDPGAVSAREQSNHVPQQPRPEKPSVTEAQTESKLKGGSMFCSQCGARLVTNSRFCSMCGIPISEEPSTEGQLSNSKQRVAAPAKVRNPAALGTKWLKFWNYFSLPVGGVLGLLISIRFMSNGLPEHGIIMAILAILQLVVAYGLHQRKLWAWQWNLALIAFPYVSVPAGPLIAIWIDGTAEIGIDGTAEIGIDGTADLVEWSVFMLIFGGLAWMWPNYVYWKKRKGLFS